MDKGIDEKALIARAEDAVRLCEKQYSPKVFGFLTPTDAAVLKKLHFGNGDISITFLADIPKPSDASLRHSPIILTRIRFGTSWT